MIAATLAATTRRCFPIYSSPFKRLDVRGPITEILKQTYAIVKLSDSNGEETAELERLINVYASQRGWRMKDRRQTPRSAGPRGRGQAAPSSEGRSMLPEKGSTLRAALKHPQIDLLIRVEADIGIVADS